MTTEELKAWAEHYASGGTVIRYRAAPAKEVAVAVLSLIARVEAAEAKLAEVTAAMAQECALPGTGALLSQLDALDARIAALAYPDPRHCEDGCLTGVERVELRRGVVSCRCRKLPSLGVHRLPEAGR